MEIGKDGRYNHKNLIQGYSGETYTATIDNTNDKVFIDSSLTDIEFNKLSMSSGYTVSNNGDVITKEYFDNNKYDTIAETLTGTTYRLDIKALSGTTLNVNITGTTTISGTTKLLGIPNKSTETQVLYINNTTGVVAKGDIPIPTLDQVLEAGSVASITPTISITSVNNIEEYSNRYIYEESRLGTNITSRIDSTHRSDVTLGPGSATMSCHHDTNNRYLTILPDSIYCNGNITIDSSVTPTADNDLVTKKYVDENVGAVNINTVLNAGASGSTTNEINLTGNGIELTDANGGGIFLESYNGGGIYLTDDAGGGIYLNDDAGGGIYLNGGGGIYLTDDVYMNKLNINSLPDKTTETDVLYIASDGTVSKGAGGSTTTLTSPDADNSVNVSNTEVKLASGTESFLTINDTLFDAQANNPDSTINISTWGVGLIMSNVGTGSVTLRKNNARLDLTATGVDIQSNDTNSTVRMSTWGNSIELTNGDGSANGRGNFNCDEIAITAGGGTTTTGKITLSSKYLPTEVIGGIEFSSANPGSNTTGSAFILKSPNGNRYKVTVDNSGVLTTTLL